MEDPRWVRLIAVGLVLAALAIGYFLLSGSFVKSKPKTDGATMKVVVETPTLGPSPIQTSTPSATGSANIRTGTYTLPATGFPVALVGVFAAGAVVAGFGLRKFPK